MTPTYPKPRRFVPALLRLPLSPQMCDLLEAGGVMPVLFDRGSRIYVTRYDAQAILAVVPREGRTGMALRRRCKELLRRWECGS